jgi:hypothetical protein
LRGVRLGHLIHLSHSGIDLLDAGTLLAGGGGNLAHDVGDAFDGTDNALQRIAGLVHQFGAAFDFAQGILNEAFDLFRGLSAALGKAADLGSDDGKPAAFFSGARGFDGGVDGEEVGLKGDLVDGGDNAGDLCRRGVDLRHDGDGVRHDSLALLGRVARAGGKLAGLARVVGALANSGGDLLKTGGGFLEAGRLFLRAGGDGLRRGCHLLGGGAGIHRVLADLLESGAQSFKGVVERRCHAADFVFGDDVERSRQIAGGDLLQSRDGRLSGTEKPRDDEAQNQTQHYRKGDGAEHHGACVSICRNVSVEFLLGVPLLDLVQP